MMRLRMFNRLRRSELSPAAPPPGADTAGSSRRLAILADEGAAQDREELLLMNSLDY
jgi:hypothetical protein